MRIITPWGRKRRTPRLARTDFVVASTLTMARLPFFGAWVNPPVTPVKCHIPYDIAQKIMECLDLPTLRVFSTLSRACREEAGPVLWKCVAFQCYHGRHTVEEDLVALQEFCQFLIRNPDKATYVRSLSLDANTWFTSIDNALDIAKTNIIGALSKTRHLIRLRVSLTYHSSALASFLNGQDFPFRLKVLDIYGHIETLAEFLGNQTNIQEMVLYPTLSYANCPTHTLPNLSRISGSLMHLGEIAPGRPITTISFIQTVTLLTLPIVLSTLQQSTAEIRHIQLTLRDEFSLCISIIATAIPHIQCLEVFMHFDATGDLDSYELAELVRMTVNALASLTELEVVVWLGYNTQSWEEEFIRLTTGEGLCPALRTVVFSGELGNCYERQSHKTPWKLTEGARPRTLWGYYR